MAHVASVAPPGLRVALLDALTRRCPRISLAQTRPGFAGVRIAYAHPQRLGVDRFLCLLAAHAQLAGPSLIVGVGTALTIDLLDADGRHHGGRIAPSPALMRQALHNTYRTCPTATTTMATRNSPAIPTPHLRQAALARRWACRTQPHGTVRILARCRVCCCTAAAPGPCNRTWAKACWYRHCTGKDWRDGRTTFATAMPDPLTNAVLRFRATRPCA